MYLSTLSLLYLKRKCFLFPLSISSIFEGKIKSAIKIAGIFNAMFLFRLLFIFLQKEERKRTLVKTAFIFIVVKVISEQEKKNSDFQAMKVYLNRY